MKSFRSGEGHQHPNPADLRLSLIVPVYNRPDELEELLESLINQSTLENFEVVLVEDGSDISSKEVAHKYASRIPLQYFFKPNSGPGDSRNFGMRQASGNYFLLVDSDCILPPDYLSNIRTSLREEYVDCFGGRDTDHDSFSVVQRAINYSMTSFWTTGGIRGSKKSASDFQPRSFNMGLSRQAFEASGGFGHIHPGEDPDLSLRLKDLGFKTRYFHRVQVIHKRRISWESFFKQMKKFGLARPILNKWHPGSAHITYWFPTFFTLALWSSIILGILGYFWPLLLFAAYFLVVFLDCSLKTKELTIGLAAIWAVLVQFTAYGYGFLKSFILVNFSKKKPQELIPELFFEPTLM